MHIWAEIFDANGTSYGRVHCINLTVRRHLDRLGDIRFQVPATNPQATRHLQVGRWVELYSAGRWVTRGVLLSQQVNAHDHTLTCYGADMGELLRRVNTLRGRVFHATPIGAVVRDLVGLVGGWAASVDSALDDQTTSIRFDGVSVLAALDTLRERHGLHFRIGPDDNRVVFGALGEASEVQLIGLAGGGKPLRRTLLPIDGLRVSHDGHDILNWVEPIGGTGDGALTLKKATRTGPYPIQQTLGPNGRACYYLTDTDSVARYGQVQAILNAPSLLPIEASTQGVVNAANALYDWAAATLHRRRAPQTVYEVSAVKPSVPILAGQQVRLTYQGVARQGGQAARYVEIDDLLWVLSVTERYGLTGQGVDLELSTVDSRPPAPSELVAGVIQLQSTATLRSTLTPNQRQQTNTLSGVTVDHAAELIVKISPLAVDVTLCRLTLQRAALTGPDTLTVRVDGQEVAGGPWLWGGSGLAVTLDVQDYLLEPLQGEHTIRLSCLYGAGDLEAELTLVEVVLGG